MKWLFFSCSLICPKKCSLGYSGTSPTKVYPQWRCSNWTETSCQQPSSIRLRSVLKKTHWVSTAATNILIWGPSSSHWKMISVDRFLRIFPYFLQYVFFWGFLKCIYISNELTVTRNSHNMPEAHSEWSLQWKAGWPMRVPFHQCSHIHLWLHLNDCLLNMPLT